MSSLAALSATDTINNYVIIGGGVQGTSVAYHLAKSKSLPTNAKITIVEAKNIASAASGKGGGFMARSWGDGSVTQQLHHVSFDLYELYANQLHCQSYRKLPVLSVAPGTDNRSIQQAKQQLAKLMPDWLDGKAGRISPLGLGDDTAQITPKEFVMAMLEDSKDAVNVVLGECVGVELQDGDNDENRVVGVRYRPREGDDDNDVKVIPANTVVVCAGPWSCVAEDWFGNSSLELPMEGVKSTSIVWKQPSEGGSEVDSTALFCGEDSRFGTHLEVYPRPDNSIYICGIGGSDYISKDELKNGAYREECNAKETRVNAAVNAFQTLSLKYQQSGELETTQACMRPCPPDAIPYMGPIPNVNGAYINAGHNCWGIAWAPGAGKAMAELILEGKSSCIDLSSFDPGRFTPDQKKGGRGRKRRGQSVGEQW